MWRGALDRPVVRGGAGVLLVAHGLAHTLPAMRATDPAGGGPAGAGTLLWIATVLWALAAAGLLAAGLGLLGSAPFRGRWREALWLGAGASLVLLPTLARSTWTLAGVLLDLALLAALIRDQRHRHPAGEGAPRRAVRDVGRQHRGRQRFAAATSLAFVGYVAVLILLRPWHTRWGSSDAELRMPLPGDELAPGPTYQVQHAVLIEAPPEAVWPWLAQLGHDRGGFYSYSRLENAFGLDVHNADRIHPEWQRIAAGDTVLATPEGYLGLDRRLGWRVARADVDRALVLETWGAFVLEPAGAGATKLIVRTRGNGGMTPAGLALAPAGLLVYEPAHFIMERRMLLGIRARAERGWKGRGTSGTAGVHARASDGRGGR